MNENEQPMIQICANKKWVSAGLCVHWLNGLTNHCDES